LLHPSTTHSPHSKERSFAFRRVIEDETRPRLGGLSRGGGRLLGHKLRRCIVDNSSGFPFGFSQASALLISSTSGKSLTDCYLTPAEALGHRAWHLKNKLGREKAALIHALPPRMQGRRGIEWAALAETAGRTIFSAKALRAAGEFIARVAGASHCGGPRLPLRRCWRSEKKRRNCTVGH